MTTFLNITITQEQADDLVAALDDGPEWDDVVKAILSGTPLLTRYQQLTLSDHWRVFSGTQTLSEYLNALSAGNVMLSCWWRLDPISSTYDHDWALRHQDSITDGRTIDDQHGYYHPATQRWVPTIKDITAP